MDLILRNARRDRRRARADRHRHRGRPIAAIQPGSPPKARRSISAAGWSSPGFVETHIHLDKSCILDRCKAEKGDLEEAIAEVAKAKAAFTPGGRLRARQAHAGESDPQRHHAYAHASRGRSRHRAARARRRAAAGRGIHMGDRPRDLHLPAGGPAQQSGHRRADGRGARARRPRGRRRALHRQQSARPDRPRLRDRARVRHRHRHASRFRPDRRRHGPALRLRAHARNSNMAAASRSATSPSCRRACRVPAFDRMRASAWPMPAWR